MASKICIQYQDFSGQIDAGLLNRDRTMFTTSQIVTHEALIAVCLLVLGKGGAMIVDRPTFDGVETYEISVKKSTEISGAAQQCEDLSA